jgi:adenylyltransferase/sulfurtransferase
MEFEITVKELKGILDKKQGVYLVDVREKQEYEFSHIDGHLIPLSQLPARIEELPKDQHIVVHCHHGMRSAQAVNYLRDHGFAKVQNLHGGIDSWSLEIDDKILRY